MFSGTPKWEEGVEAINQNSKYDTANPFTAISSRLMETEGARHHSLERARRKFPFKSLLIFRQ